MAAFKFTFGNSRLQATYGGAPDDGNLYMNAGTSFEVTGLGSYDNLGKIFSGLSTTLRYEVRTDGADGGYFYYGNNPSAHYTSLLGLNANQLDSLRYAAGAAGRSETITIGVAESRGVRSGVPLTYTETSARVVSLAPISLTAPGRFFAGDKVLLNSLFKPLLDARNADGSFKYTKFSVSTSWNAPGIFTYDVGSALSGGWVSFNRADLLNDNNDFFKLAVWQSSYKLQFRAYDARAGLWTGESETSLAVSQQFSTKTLGAQAFGTAVRLSDLFALNNADTASVTLAFSPSFNTWNYRLGGSFNKGSAHVTVTTTSDGWQVFTFDPNWLRTLSTNPATRLAALNAELAKITISRTEIGDVTVGFRVTDATGGWEQFVGKYKVLAPVPTLTAAAAQTLTENQIIAASSLIAGVDAKGAPILQYEFSTAQPAHFFLGARPITPTHTGSRYTVTINASDLPNLRIAAEAAGTTEAVSIRARDETGWSSAVSVSLTTLSADTLLARTIGDTGVLNALTANLTSGYRLDFTGLKNVFDAATAGGVSASEIAALKALAGLLNSTGSLSIATDAEFKAIARRLAGKLTAGTSATAAQNLVDATFYGTDHPTSFAANDHYDHYATLLNKTLFGPSGKPQAADVTIASSSVKDFNFLQGLYAFAQQEPDRLASQIADKGIREGHHVYTVRIGGDVIAVDDQLPVDSSGHALFGGGSRALWVGLVEKAYVQSKGGSYDDLQSLDLSGLGDVMGRSINAVAVSNYDPSIIRGYANNLSYLIGIFAGKGEIGVYATQNSAAGLLANHLYALVGVNQAANPAQDTFRLNMGNGATQDFSFAQLEAAGAKFETRNWASRSVN